MTDEATAAPAAEKKKYQVFHIGIGQTNKDVHDAVVALSDQLGCTPASLAWLAMAQMLQNPPITAPEGSQQRAGAASGFWVWPVTDNEGRATQMRVIEVKSRGDLIGGQTFFRYDKGDTNTTGRAERQAIKAAQHLCQLLGLDPTGLVAERLPEASEESA